MDLTTYEIVASSWRGVGNTVIYGLFENTTERLLKVPLNIKL